MCIKKKKPNQFLFQSFIRRAMFRARRFAREETESLAPRRIERRRASRAIECSDSRAIRPAVEARRSRRTLHRRRRAVVSVRCVDSS